MAQATIEKPSARRSPLEIIVDRIWRFFCSVRAAVFEIVILAVLVLIGTLRGSDAPQWLANAIPATQPLVDRWYDWEVFRSLPFMAILAILSIAITVCTINRVPAIWKAISNPSVRTTRGFVESTEVSAAIPFQSQPAESFERLRESLSKQRYRVLHEIHGEDVHVFADKNRLSKLGTFPFHLALILMLIGGIIGARYGFRENSFVIPEGSIRTVGHNTGLSVELIKFNDSWREDGTPAEYRSELVIYDSGQQVKHGFITVNNPMTHGSVTFYQTSYGQSASFLITDKNGQVVFEDSIPLGLYTSSTNPDAPAGVQQLPQIGAQLHVIAPDEDPLNAPELDNLRLRSGQMYIQLRSVTEDSDVDRLSAVVDQGDTVELGDILIQFQRERRFTLLQIASNPGMPIFWAASFLLVGGLVVTFYFPHRRIRGIISPQPSGGSTTRLAPLARWDWSGQRDFRRIIERIESDLAVEATVIDRNRDSETQRERNEHRYDTH
jgi:cytochrome c biogenesis protein